MIALDVLYGGCATLAFALFAYLVYALLCAEAF